MNAGTLDRDDVLARLTEAGVQAFYRSLGVETFQANGAGNWITRSPLRPDAKPSFSIRRDDGVWIDRSTGEGGSIFDAAMLVRGCDFPQAIEYVAEVIGGTVAPAAPAKPNKPRRISAAYGYVDEAGQPLYEAVRYEPKGFSQRRPDGNGGWVYNLQGVRRVLYRLPEILEADSDRKIIIVEGEKDADRLAELGLIATTNAMGAGAWRDEYNGTLAGRHVVILPDNDEAGEKHAQQVAATIHPTAASVRIVRLPGLPEKGDVSDWLDAGGTFGQLRRLVEHALLWMPSDHGLPPSAALVVTSLADVEARPTDWLWHGWLAAGKVHIIGGHAGDGKSTITTQKAATLSNGGLWPDGTQAPVGRTLFLLAEDGLEDTLKPRLEQHGANSELVFALKAVREPGGSETFFNIRRHLPLLEAAIAEHEINLVVIDPVTSFMPNSDRNAEGDVRDVLTPLGMIADRTGAAILCVMHVGKPNGSNRRPLQQLLGATAFGAIARVVWMVAPLPADAGADRRVLAVVKSNLALKPPALEWSRDVDQPIEWHGESQHDISELLGGVQPQPRADAEGFLRETLANGPVPFAEVKQRASDRGISWATVRRAAEEVIGVKKYKQPGVVNGPWFWQLPDASKVFTQSETEHLREMGSESKVLTPKDAQVSTFDSSNGRYPNDDQISHEYQKVLSGGDGEHVRSNIEGVEGAHSEYIEVSTFDSPLSGQRFCPSCEEQGKRTLLPLSTMDICDDCAQVPF